MRKVAFFSVVCAVAVGGCELIADFDRSKIPTDTADAGDAGQVSFPDGAVVDAQAMDATTFDGGDGATSTDDGGDGGTASDASDGGG